MCGICGWFNRYNKIDGKILVAMNQIGKHRGPDDEGYSIVSCDGIKHFLGDDSINLPYMKIQSVDDDLVGFLGLGHRRLSIIDLSSSGHQPMDSVDGKLCITYNGEIYNYVEVREELKEKGYTFRSTSDTEVILAAYTEWGEECVVHFNGMWAFAIWDSVKKRIFCSRDRLGAKPFHYYVDNDNFVFGSELKQVIQNPIVPRLMNEDYLSIFMLLSLSDYSDETLIKDIKSLRGGYNLIFSLPNDEHDKPVLNVYRYWDIDTKVDKQEGAIAKTFRNHDYAVRIRLRSDVPIGIMLSGGLDSSVLVTEISEILEKKGIKRESINTYTSCYEKFAEGDEKSFAQIVNKYCGTKENLVYPDEQDTFSVFKDMIWHMEGLAEFYSMGGFLTLREVAKYGNKVIINGQGADETMFGYERYYVWYLKNILRQCGLVAYLKEMHRITSNSRLGLRELIEYSLYFGNARIRRYRCRRRMKPYVTNRIIDCFDNNRSVDKFLEFQSLEDMQYNELRGTQLTHILRMDDRNYMAFSMESRVPFIDYRYVESAVSIPEEMKIKDGFTKYLMRKYIEGKLPDEVVWRKNKMGWPSPRDRWIERLNKTEVEKLFINPRSDKYFDIEKVRELWRNDPRAFAFEKFLSVELFMRLFDVDVA